VTQTANIRPGWATTGAVSDIIVLADLEYSVWSLFVLAIEAPEKPCAMESSLFVTIAC